MVYCIQKISFFIMRFPSYQLDKLRDNEVFCWARRNLASECSKYFQFTDQVRDYYSIVALAYLILGLKNVFYIWFTIMNWSRHKFGQHKEFQVSKEIPHSSQERRDNELLDYACLRTNCSRLSATSTIHEDLLKIPTFSICFPKLLPYYNPSIISTSVGLLNSCTITFVFITLGCLVQVYLYFLGSPIAPDLMFILCPRIEIELTKRKMRQALINLLRSMACFKMIH